MSSKNKITYIKAINTSLIQSMSKDKNIICYGLGINDPKEFLEQQRG